MLKNIEKIRENLKEEFSERNMDTENKIAFAIGYLSDNPKTNKTTALQIIYEILLNKF